MRAIRQSADAGSCRNPVAARECPGRTCLAPTLLDAHSSKAPCILSNAKIIHTMSGIIRLRRRLRSHEGCNLVYSNFSYAKRRKAPRLTLSDKNGFRAPPEIRCNNAGAASGHEARALCGTLV